METILLIEDDELILESISELLTINGFNVLTAKNGKEGLMQAVFHNPTLILIDVMMPIMDGHETVKILRKNPAFNFTPIIFMSAKAKLEDKRSGLDMGAEDYLTKPVSAKILLNGIESKIEKFRKIKKANKHSSGFSAHNVYFKAMHEVNTSLAGILGSVSILEDFLPDLDKTKQFEIIHHIKVAATRIKRIFTNNQWLEKITRNNLGIEEKNKEKVSIAYILQKTFMDIDEINPGSTARIKTNLKPFDLITSKEILIKIFYELLSNSIKFSKPNSEIKITGMRKANSYILTIEDGSIGFLKLPEINHLLFKQYNREFYEQQGLGIGLYISLNLMKQLNIIYSTKKCDDTGVSTISKLMIPM